eukprot:736-Heterococcus_DN1.PRE.2
MNCNLSMHYTKLFSTAAAQSSSHCYERTQLQRHACKRCCQYCTTAFASVAITACTLEATTAAVSLAADYRHDKQNNHAELDQHTASPCCHGTRS